jgi:hypothetical protein
MKVISKNYSSWTEVQAQCSKNITLCAHSYSRYLGSVSLNTSIIEFTA